MACRCKTHQVQRSAGSTYARYLSAISRSSARASAPKTARRSSAASIAAYRDAWKKRGEVVSILANVARKVDRLDYVLHGAPASQDEAALDTAVDLLVYCIKYQTYLADVDVSAADVLFRESGLDPPFSHGCAGFEHLLSHVALSASGIGDLAVDNAAAAVLTQFDELQACFIGINAVHPPAARLFRVQSLTDAAACLLLTLHREPPGLVR